MASREIEPMRIDEKDMEQQHEETLKVDQPEELVREFDPKFVKRTMLKLDMLLLPILTLTYMCSSLDKSNLGNAKTLGMIKDIGGDPTGERYALLNAMYFISYAPFMVPFALLGKRTRMAKVLTGCALAWGIAATCFAAVKDFHGSFACRFFIGLGEAGFSPLIQVYLSRFYTRQKLGVRVAFWLAMAPFAGFLNGIIAYGVAFIHSPHLESWRILFLIEGLLTIVIAVIGLLLLPENIDTCRFLSAEEKDYLKYERYMSMGHETNEINWKHAREAPLRWQQYLPMLQNMCQQISGAALSAFLPTFTRENGFEGANAQIATLAPYGAAIVLMIIASRISDRYNNRGWPSQFGWAMMVVGFSIWLGCDTHNRAAHITALILAEAGHYICTPLIVTWSANNAGSESRRAVAVPLAVSTAQAVAVGSGYLFPSRDSPKYTKGLTVEVALSVGGMIFTAIYQILIKWENAKRDKREGGPPAPGFRPDTATYADDAPGFRYIG